MSLPSAGRPMAECGFAMSSRAALAEHFRGPMITRPLQSILAAPFMRRIGFHARRLGGQMDRHFFSSLLTAIIGFVVVAAIVITLVEPEKLTFAGFGSSFYWAVTTVI